MEVIHASRALDSKLVEFSSAIGESAGQFIHLRRAPSFFDALCVEGRKNDVIAVVQGRKVAGVAVRSEKDCFSEQGVRMIGYLGALLLDPSVRRGLALARGFGLARRLHEAGGADFYLTTIFEGNAHARAALESRRAGLPWYEPLGMVSTLLLHPSSLARCSPPADVYVRVARRADLPSIVEFLAVEGPRREFFPRYLQDDFGSEGQLLRDLEAEDIRVAERGGRIVGVAAAWDQSGFRSWVPCANAPELCPRPLEYRTLAIPCVERDEPAVFTALVAALGNEAHPELLVAAFHEADPLFPLLKSIAAAEIRSSLYAVAWARNALPVPGSMKVPYLEAGSL